MAAQIGVLALQGDFAAHVRMLRALGASPREVRTVAQLEGVDGLVIPGGESTVMSLGIRREGLADPLRELARAGTPILGTCAGMIMLDSEHLGIMDITTRRNAWGRQIRSFEADLRMEELAGPPVRAVFIRAPWVERMGPEVRTLAVVEQRPVAVREGSRLAVAFHPELGDEPRLHEWFLRIVGERALGARADAR